jgi:hypothetical protein
MPPLAAASTTILPAVVAALIASNSAWWYSTGIVSHWLPVVGGHAMHDVSQVRPLAGPPYATSIKMTSPLPSCGTAALSPLATLTLAEEVPKVAAFAMPVTP